MDKLKIENFAREHLQSPFPSFRTLTAQEAEQIRNSIAMRLDCPHTISSLDLVCCISERVIPISANAENDGFNLKDVIKELGIEAKDKIFVNWYRLDEIDEISLNDLSHYFDDLWYPTADAIELFDDTLDWILSVDYSGNMGYLKFK